MLERCCLQRGHCALTCQNKKIPDIICTVGLQVVVDVNIEAWVKLTLWGFFFISFMSVLPGQQLDKEISTHQNRKWTGWGHITKRRKI